MRISEGSKDAKYIECISPKRNRWRVRWDFSKKDDSEEVYMFCEEDFNHKPSTEEVRNIIVGYYNRIIEDKILQGFKWNDTTVWLSTENQFNYKAAFDLAVQTGGASLPVTFKFGTDEEPVYHEFADIAELQDFYTKAMKFVQDTLAEGWALKDSINYKLYEV